MVLSSIIGLNVKRCSHRKDSMIKIDQLVENLRRDGLRVTNARKQLLSVLLDSKKAYTKDEILNQLKSQGYDPITLYRNLNAFDKSGILLRLKDEDGKDRYLLNPERKHYHVILCKACKQVEPIQSCTIDTLEEFARSKGFKEVSHVLELHGLCEDCS